MRHVRNLGFDCLEGRRLLSRLHSNLARPPRAAAVPLVLDGTLTVNNRASTSMMNFDGGSSNSVPVSGKLGALGQVRGTWNETVDQYGAPTGLDTLRLRGPQGGVVIAFNDTNPGRPHPVGHGAVYYEHAQTLVAGSRAYARATESGSIDLTTNNARSQVVSITLKSASG
jgi:hypothetical protein